MGYEEKREIKEEEDRERVLVPIRHEETINQDEIQEESAEKIWKIPRRWRVY